MGPPRVVVCVAKTLDAAQMQLDDLATSGASAFVREVALDHDELRAIPTALLQFRGVRELSLRHNRLKRLPEELLRRLTHLRRLDLESNRLSELPRRCTLTSLFHLNLGYNRLERAPAELMLACRKSLATLGLESNRLRRLPELCGAYDSLTELRLSDNRLIELPSALADARRLRTLHLDRNQLTELPRWVATLPHLTELDVAHNRLVSLPHQLVQPSGRWAADQLHLSGIFSNPFRRLPWTSQALPHSWLTARWRATSSDAATLCPVATEEANTTTNERADECAACGATFDPLLRRTPVAFWRCTVTGFLLLELYTDASARYVGPLELEAPLCSIACAARLRSPPEYGG